MFTNYVQVNQDRYQKRFELKNTNIKEYLLNYAKSVCVTIYINMQSHEKQYITMTITMK